MITELYDALKEAGASDASARKAAEVMAAYESAFSKIGADLTVLKWTAGFNLGATMTLLFLALRH
jgi:hypothetical protein